MSASDDDHGDACGGAANEHSVELAELITREAARRGGLLPFDRFMELALYAPGLGYYVAGAHKLGRGGDFVTAPELSPLFARSIAAQCCEVLSSLDGGDVLEFGAGSGALAAELLAALADSSTLPRHYLILELSPELRRRQQDLIAQRVPELLPRVRWLERLPTGFRGCVFANEVLDAMPVHRFRVAPDGRPLELFVKPSPEGWAEVAALPDSRALEAAVRALQEVGLAVDPGYESEINLRLGPWILGLARGMEQGLVLIIDYGYPQREYYCAERRGGTLMCHYRHQALTNPYLRVGLQDITAHVDFTAAARAGEQAGLQLAGYTTQANFLIGCGLDRLLSQLPSGPEAMNHVLEAKQLLLPSAMGERFQVVGLSKGMDRPWLGFSFRDLRQRLYRGHSAGLVGSPLTTTGDMR